MKMKRNARQGDDEEEYGHHHPNQRNTRSLHREQFEVLSHIAKGNECGQQHGQRKREGHEGDAGIVEKLQEDIESQPLAHQFVDPSPRKLHHEDKEANEKCPHKKLQELAEDERIEPFDVSHVRNKGKTILFRRISIGKKHRLPADFFIFTSVLCVQIYCFFLS